MEPQTPTFEQTEPVAAPSPAPDAPPKFEETEDATPDIGFGQQALAAGEAVGRGLIGHTGTALLEKGLAKAGASGLTPDDQTSRQEYLRSENPALNVIGEAGGFGLGSLVGVGIAKPVEAIGAGVTGLLGLGQAASLGGRLAAGAVKAGTELAALQADDEVSKAVNGTSKGVGDAISNVGLASVLGAAGGGLFTGVGAAVKGGLDAIGLKEFADRLAYRGANPHPNEMVEKEFHDAISEYHAMNDELTGAHGLRAGALSKIMPEEVTPAIADQVQNVLGKADSALGEMADKGVPPRLVRKFNDSVTSLHEVLNQADVSPGQIFDTLNDLKKDLSQYAKGRFGPFSVSPTDEAYDFINTTKRLGHDIKTGLEDSDTWGRVADLQKQLNASWSKVLPAVKDVQGKFMEKVGGEYVPSTQKFLTYLNQNGRATSETVRQKMLGNFVDAVQDHFNATDAAYRAAGINNPHPAPGMGALKESLKKVSIGARLADAWHDRLGPEAVGNALAAVAGEGVAHAVGIPVGFGGAYAGKEVLGKLFGSIIKPVAEKVSSLPAYRGAMNFVKEVAQGNSRLATAAGNLFKAGAKTIPNHWLPDARRLLELDDQLKETGKDPGRHLMNVSGDLPHYLPDNAQHLSMTAMNAVNVLNAQRPHPIKVGVLDDEIEPSKADLAAYQRKLEIAEQPLAVLKHIDDGTLLPADVEVLHALYPDHYQKMATQVLSAMTDHVHDGGSVPYRLRQGLSLFLGQPLDSTMTPQSMIAIQGTFGQSRSQQQGSNSSGGGGKAKGSASKMGKMATNLETNDQARSARANKA